LKDVLILQTAFDEPIDIVLSHYPGKVLDISNESYKDKKGVWWIKTPGGMKILKKVSNSEETLRFILDAVRHLMKNGVKLPGICKTMTGSDYVSINGTCYVLTEAIEGRNPSYSVPGELHRISAELAKFHKASEGFTPSPGTKPKYHLGLWIDDYARQLEDIKSFYEKEREFPYFYKRAENAIAGLKGKEYEEWVEKAQTKGCLCHQDFAAGNLILTPTGDIFVLDTDSITIDIPARDIRKLLNKVMKKTGRWDINLAKSIMHSYQSVNPLTASEWEVVRLDLMFPHLFIGAVSKYYYKRDKEWSEDKYLQRIAEISDFEKTIMPVLDNFNKIKPV
jgi:CotS family spore coat protein